MSSEKTSMSAPVHAVVICFYIPIVWWVHTFGDPQMTRFWEHRGYRAAVGGYWGQWNMGDGRMKVTMWWPSPCGHYPKPLLANHDKPLRHEEYR